MREQFESIFKKYGFEVLDFQEQNKCINAWINGKDLGFYLSIQNQMFSAYTIYDFMKSIIFESQFFDTFEEIEGLLQKNYVFQTYI